MPVIRRYLPSMLAALLLTLATGGGAVAAPQEVGLDDPISLDLEQASVREVLQVAAGMLGATPKIDAALAGTLTVRLDAVPVHRMLDEICERSGCRWALEAGEPPALRVSVVRPGAEGEEPISIALEEADLREVLATFAQIAGGASVYLAPELSGTVSIELTAVPWTQALDAVCERAKCVWHLEEGTPPLLRVTVAGQEPGQDLGRIELSSQAPPAGTARRVEPEVQLRFEVPGFEPLEALARFRWDRPVVAVAAGGRPRWEARLTWIALGPRTRAVLPLLVRCGSEADGDRVVLLDPVAWPLTRSHRFGAGEVSLTLLPAARERAATPTAERLLEAGAPEDDCYPPRAVDVAYASQPVAGGTTSRGSATLRAPGAVLQVATVPSRQAPTSYPRFAVVMVGRQGDGTNVALLTEDATGAVALELGRVAPGRPWKTRVEAASPVDLEMTLAPP